MSSWDEDTLARIAEADDLHVAPYREDGETYGTPTWIWSVVVDGALYARAYHGTSSRWYRAALREGAGRVSVAGDTHRVAFEPVAAGPLQDRIDAAYRAKYGASSYLASMIGSRARAATVRIAPRDAAER
ncbi:MAG: DUF2255 family protein [Myxococcales bacterium]|nr:DUF2255 family protein [Myxococcales bacterium]MCB9734080.1 DUF2255 family protein [Deltaproteobacteria bacterium]